MSISKNDTDECVAWFAMSAPYRNEKKAEALLQQEGIESFLPMRYEIITNRYGGKSRKLVPAISNLIFAHTTRSKIQEVKCGVKYLQYKVKPENGKFTPIIVPDQQMEQFMRVCKTLNDQLTYLSPEEVNLTEGQRVKVIGGEFDGIEGTFVKIKGRRQRRIIVIIPDIAAVATTEISDGLIEVLG